MKQTLVKALVITDRREYSWWMDGIDAESVESRLLNISELRVAAEGLKWSLLPLVEQQPDVLLLDSNLSASFLLRITAHVRNKMPNLPVLLLPKIHDDDDALPSLAEFSSDTSSDSGSVNGEPHVNGQHTNGQHNGDARHEREFTTDAIVCAVRYAHGRQQLQHRLLQMALKDDLTRLHNRRGFMVLAKQQLKWARSTGQHLLLFFADLDGLKLINDQFGHREGDRALSLVAASIKNTFRRSDVTARLSGDEFVALILQEPGRAADAICQRLQANLATYAATECRYKLTLSIGVAHFDPDHPLTLQELLRQADTALYQHKRGGHRSSSASALVEKSVNVPQASKHFLSTDCIEPTSNAPWLPIMTLEPSAPSIQP